MARAHPATVPARTDFFFFSFVLTVGAPCPARFSRLAVPVPRRGAPLLPLPLQEGLAHRQISAETGSVTASGSRPVGPPCPTCGGPSLPPLSLFFLLLYTPPPITLPSPLPLSHVFIGLGPSSFSSQRPLRRGLVAAARQTARHGRRSGRGILPSVIFFLTRSHLLMFPFVNHCDPHKPFISTSNIHSFALRSQRCACAILIASGSRHSVWICRD